MNLIRVDNVNKKINDYHILRNINLTLPDTGMIFIVGKSGAGKTSLMSILGGLDKEYQGDYYFNGNIIAKENESLLRFRKDDAAFIFQDNNILGELSIKDNIDIALNDKYVKDEFNSIDILDLTDCGDKATKYLSGGERQRAAIARAVEKDFKVLFADEPTGNLDKDNSEKVFRCLKAISTDRLVVIVTHDTESAYRYADRIIEMSDGSIISDNPNIPDKISVSTHIIDKEIVEETGKKNKSILNLSKKHLHNNKRKNGQIIIMCILLLTFSLLSTGLFYSMQTIKGSINTIMGNDKLEIYKTADEEYLLDFIDDDFEKEINELAIREYVGYYYGLLLYGFHDDKKSKPLTYSVYKNNDFFKKRFQDENIEITDDKYGIIIGEKMAADVFETSDCLGETIWIGENERTCIKCTVTGVSEILPENISMCISEGLMQELYSYIFDGDMLNLVSEDYLTYAFVAIEEQDNSYDILYGRRAESEGEIVINAGAVNSIINILQINSGMLSIDDIIRGKISDKLLNSLLNHKVNLQYSSYVNTELTIVGINNNTDDKVTAYMEADSISELKKCKDNKADVYLSDLNKNKSEVIGLADKYKYTYSDNGDARVTMIASKLAFPGMALGVVAVIFMIVTFLFVKMTTKLNIINQTGEIAILKALGIDNKKINRIYLFENFILYIFSSAVTLIISGIVVILNKLKMLTVEGMQLFTLKIPSIIMIIGAGLIVVYFATIIELKKMNKINLLELLRKK